MFLLSIICRDCKNTVFCISNMQKTVFLQSLRTIFKKKIHFWGITECSKHYFSNSGIDHFKTKVAWIHHNIQEILLLPSLHLSPPNIMRENQVVHRSRLGFWYSIPVFADNQWLDIEYPALQVHSNEKMFIWKSDKSWEPEKIWKFKNLNSKFKN